MSRGRETVSAYAGKTRGLPCRINKPKPFAKKRRCGHRESKLSRPHTLPAARLSTCLRRGVSLYFNQRYAGVMVAGTRRGAPTIFARVSRKCPVDTEAAFDRVKR